MQGRSIARRASCPPITPVPAGVERPLWSVMIPTYNSAGYLRYTLESVLAQDPGPDVMQIEVLDDCSTADDPLAVVNELGQGRVAFFRQPHNVGSVANINTCVQRSRGRLVHILHSDDLVLPGFYDALGALLGQYPDVGAAYCRFSYVDENGSHLGLRDLEQDTAGKLDNWQERIATRQRIHYGSLVVRREVYERLDGFDETLPGAEDWEMEARIATHFPVAYEPRPLACYRVRDGSVTSRLVRTGANVLDVRRCIAIVREYLPPDKASAIGRNALDHYTIWAYHVARRLLRRGDAEGARNQWREALKTSRSPKAIAWAVLLFGDLLCFYLAPPGKRKGGTPFSDYVRRVRRKVLGLNREPR